jgi:hypothetical protein
VQISVAMVVNRVVRVPTRRWKELWMGLQSTNNDGAAVQCAVNGHNRWSGGYSKTDNRERNHYRSLFTEVSLNGASKSVVHAAEELKNTERTSFGFLYLHSSWFR